MTSNLHFLFQDFHKFFMGDKKFFLNICLFYSFSCFAQSQQNTDGHENIVVKGNFNSIFTDHNWTIDEEKFLKNSKEYAISHLFVPNDSVFLERPCIIKKIQQCLQKKDKKLVPRVALIGISGSGKTTIGRKYATTKLDKNVVWELNAETLGSIEKSFICLGYALCSSRRIKENLENILSLEDISIRRNLLVNFVKSELKKKTEWILIYDNVINFQEMRVFFPDYVEEWGNGEIIITTQNTHISNSGYVDLDKIVNVEELDIEEEFTLFCKILSKNELGSEEKKQLESFLSHIPPFPLDVSMAAHYIKETRVSYETYLKKVNSRDQDFDSLNKSILNDITNYDNNRQKIIKESIKKILEENSKCEELLIFIGLLNSQDIPVKILELCKKDTLVHQLIYQLRNYSFITSNYSRSVKSDTFSIHRSVHDFIRKYVKENHLDAKFSQVLLKKFGKLVLDYMKNIISKEDLKKMKFFTSHCEMFLDNTSNSVSNDSKNSIRGDLGLLFYFLRDDIKAKKFLDDSIKNLEDELKKKSDNSARKIIYLANINMELGKHQLALKLLESVVHYNSEYLHQHNPDSLRSLSFMGSIYIYIGEYQKALPILMNCVKRLRVLPDEKNSLGRSLCYLGNLYFRLGKYHEAEKSLLESCSIFDQYLDDHDHIKFAVLFVHLGNTSRKLGKYQKAKNYLEKAVQIYKKNFSEVHADTAWAMLYLVDLYIDLEEYDKAKLLAEKSLKVHKLLFDRNNIRVSEANLRIGNVYRKIGLLEEAKAILENVLEKHKVVYGKDHLEFATILMDLSELYLLKEELSESYDLALEALNIYKKSNHDDQYKVFKLISKIKVAKKS